MSSERLDNQSPEAFGQTPSQTVGPYFHYGIAWRGGADMVGDRDMGGRPDLFPEANYKLAMPHAKGEIAGEVIEIYGLVTDGAGALVDDALIEVWQANASGRYASADDPRTDLPLDAGFIGFGRSSTDAAGVYRFRTVRPGRVPGPGNSLQAPHLAVGVMGRGLLKRLTTRLYFDDAAENGEDPILPLVPEVRRSTLIARKEGPGVYRFDIVLQGEGETVFFDV